MIIYLNFLKEIIAIYSTSLDFFFMKLIKNILLGIVFKKEDVKQLS